MNATGEEKSAIFFSQDQGIVGEFSIWLKEILNFLSKSGKVKKFAFGNGC